MHCGGYADKLQHPATIHGLVEVKVEVKVKVKVEMDVM